jgi:membrane-bound lytic murein transglycosylase
MQRKDRYRSEKSSSEKLSSLENYLFPRTIDQAQCQQMPINLTAYSSRASSAASANRDKNVLSTGDYTDLVKLNRSKNVIKGEIKNWIAAFEADHGHTPSNSDKAEIEDKFISYKLVKMRIKDILNR